MVIMDPAEFSGNFKNWFIILRSSPDTFCSIFFATLAGISSSRSILSSKAKPASRSRRLWSVIAFIRPICSSFSMYENTLAARSFFRNRNSIILSSPSSSLKYSARSASCSPLSSSISCWKFFCLYSSLKCCIPYTSLPGESFKSRSVSRPHQGKK